MLREIKNVSFLKNMSSLIRLSFCFPYYTFIYLSTSQIRSRLLLLGNTIVP